MKKQTRSAVEDFIALPDSEKDAIAAALDSESTDEMLERSKPLSKTDEAKWKAFKRKSGQVKPRKSA